jgi:parallel beta-helix repeat protein
MKNERTKTIKSLGLLLATLIGLGGVLLVVGSAQALIPVDPSGGCPQTLSVPGEYILTGDLACSGAVSGVLITASNVVFHLAVHTISDTTCDENVSFGGIFVQGGISGVRIDGGTVSGFNDGIILSSSNSRVVGMTVMNACIFGMAVSGRNNRLEKNVVTASGVDGIGLGQASRTRIIANDISGNGRVGVDISNFSDKNIVEDNIIHHNGFGAGEQGGVAIFNGTDNVIRNNAVNNNFAGILIESPGNLAQGNTVNGSVNTGILISNLGAPSSVIKNTVLGSGFTDMSDGNAGCAGDTWKNNTFETDLVVGASDGGPGAGCIQ